MPNCSTCQHSWQCFTEPIKPPDKGIVSTKFVFDSRLWDNIANPVVCQMAKMLKPSALMLSNVTELQKTSADFRSPHPLAGARYACDVYRVKDALDVDTKTLQDLADSVLVFPSPDMLAQLNGDTQVTAPSGWPPLPLLLMHVESVTKVHRHKHNSGRPPWAINFYSPFHRHWWHLR